MIEDKGIQYVTLGEDQFLEFLDGQTHPAKFKLNDSIWIVRYPQKHSRMNDGSSEVKYIPIEFLNKPNQDESSNKNDEQHLTSLKTEDFYFTLEPFAKGTFSSMSEQYYDAWLYSKLDGIPIKWIGKCKGCYRFFLNPTEREKLYCNSSCASRSIAKDKRENLRKNRRKYKAYLKKQRKYMKKRYNEMRKAQLGPNAKVRRKLRKRTA